MPIARPPPGGGVRLIWPTICGVAVVDVVAARAGLALCLELPPVASTTMSAIRPAATRPSRTAPARLELAAVCRGRRGVPAGGAPAGATPGGGAWVGGSPSATATAVADSDGSVWG